MPASLAQKLQLKPGEKVALVNVPEGRLAALAAELEGCDAWDASKKAAGKLDAMLLFVNNLAEAEKLGSKAIRSSGADRLLWIAYPKGSAKVKTDVNRDTLWKTLEPTGWRPVRQVALDAVWSAMRFRPAEKVGK
jgi:hypothetical protein